jgi:hypothetical protein
MYSTSEGVPGTVAGHKVVAKYHDHVPLLIPVNGYDLQSSYLPD